MEKVAQFWLLLHLVVVAAAVTPNPLPLNCSDSNRVCTSFLAFSPFQRQTLADVQSMFDVLPADITSDDGPAPTPYLYVRKNCSCSAPTKRYLTNTTFTVREDGASVYDAVIAAYHGLAVLTNISRPARAGAVVSLHLLCGCSSGLWNYLMSYVMQPEDSLESLASRFGVSMESIEAVNKIADPSNLTTGALYFIPLNSVPGLPYSSNQPPAPSPGVPSSSEITFPDEEEDSEHHLWPLAATCPLDLPRRPKVLLTVVIVINARKQSGVVDGGTRMQLQAGAAIMNALLGEIEYPQ